MKTGLNTITSIGVFCGSSSGCRDQYVEKAATLGRTLAAEKITLVYGAGNVGLMGVMADACLAAGGKVIGVITHKLSDAGLTHPGITETVVVENMSLRKNKIAEISDAFIALPGGYGTFDELFEVLTLMQLDIMQKPVGLLNAAGFFSPFLKLIDHAVAEQFIRKEHRRIFTEHEEADALIRQLRVMQPVKTTKWLKDFKTNKF